MWEKKMNVETVFIHHSALTLIKREILNTANNYETGGVLLGYISDSNAVITHASSPGPNAIQKRQSIEIDTEYCQNFINQVFESSDGRYSYLGDWHSHTKNSLLYSQIDQRELYRLSKHKKSRVPFPLMMIVYGGLEIFRYRVYQMYRRDILLITEQLLSSGRFSL
jgi:integrative and conjugative element protein (TIGR02256 family)